MAWGPVDLINTVCLAIVGSSFNRELCEVDIDIYNATGWHQGGFVGFRRNYLQELPQDRFAALPRRDEGEGPYYVCENHWAHELLYAILDVTLCTVLVVYTAYIAYSYGELIIAGEHRPKRAVAPPPKSGKGLAATGPGKRPGGGPPPRGKPGVRV